MRRLRVLQLFFDRTVVERFAPSVFPHYIATYFVYEFCPQPSEIYRKVTIQFTDTYYERYDDKEFLDLDIVCDLYPLKNEPSASLNERILSYIQSSLVELGSRYGWSADGVDKAANTVRTNDYVFRGRLGKPVKSPDKKYVCESYCELKDRMSINVCVRHKSKKILEQSICNAIPSFQIFDSVWNNVHWNRTPRSKGSSITRKISGRLTSRAEISNFISHEQWRVTHMLNLL